MNHNIEHAHVSIEEYTKMQTKFYEIVEENYKTYTPVYESLKKAKIDWVKSYGHPLIGWNGLTNEKALALAIRTRFPEDKLGTAVGFTIEKVEMSPIPYTLLTVKGVHDATLKQLIDIPKETVKVDRFSDLLKLKREIAEDSRRGVGNYLLINPRFKDEVDDYKDLDTDALRSDFEKVFTVVYSELMPDDKLISFCLLGSPSYFVIASCRFVSFW